jgi:hypothetical protein
MLIPMLYRDSMTQFVIPGLTRDLCKIKIYGTFAGMTKVT